MNDHIENNRDLAMGRPLFEQPADPIDALLIRFREDVEFDMLPDEGEQTVLVAAVREAQQGMATDRQESQRHLTNRNEGRIAAIVYPYRNHGIDSRTLLGIGARGLVLAAVTHSGRIPFNDYSTAVIRRALQKELPDAGIDTELSQGPLEEWVVQLIPDPYNPVIPKPPSPVIVEQSIIADSQKQQAYKPAYLRPNSRSILPLVHLPTADIMEHSGLSRRAVFSALKEAREIFDVSTRMEVAVQVLAMGIQFKDLRKPAPLDRHTLRQRVIAPQLDRSNSKIGETVGLGSYQLSREIGSLLLRMNARTRIEAMLMARTNAFEPTEEELGHPALREFSPREREVASMIYLAVGDIAEALSADKTNIMHTIRHLREKTDTDNNVELALELLRRGVTFDVPPPKEPLDEEEMHVASHLGPTAAVMAEALGMPRWRLWKILPAMLHKTGARTPVELALMLKMYPPSSQGAEA